MNAELQTKVQASPAQSFTPVQTGLLQRKSALCNTLGLVEDSGRVYSTGQGMIQTKLKINKRGIVVR